MADKSMKVTYREYVVEADEKGSISVTKNGEVCDNAKGALREIAQQAGFEVDSNWTSRQFGGKLIKFLSEGTPAPVASAKEAEPKKEEPKKEEPKQNAAREITEKDLYKGEILLKEYICRFCESKFAGDFIPEDRCPMCGAEVEESRIFKERIFLQLAPKEPEKPATKYDANSRENSKDFYDNDPDLRAFYENWKKYTPEQVDAVKKEAEAGDAIAQYKIGHMLSDLLCYKFEADSVHDLDGIRKVGKDYAYRLRKKVLEGQLDLTIDEAIKWLYASAKQGFGLAMKELARLNIDGPDPHIRNAVKWYHEYRKVCSWDDIIGILWGGDRMIKDHIMLTSKIDVYERQLKEKENQLEEKDRQLKEKDKYITERDRQIEEKDNRIDGLEEELKQLRKDYEDTCASEEKFRDKYLALKYADSRSSSSSSSSSKRSSGTEKVDVRIRYRYEKTLPAGFTSSETEHHRMTEAEYKRLVNGSMKARIAYVNAHCSPKLFVKKIIEVDVSLE